MGEIKRERFKLEEDSPVTGATKDSSSGSNQDRIGHLVWLTRDEADALERAGEGEGMRLLGFMEDILRTEARRLLHIERCRPKPKIARPVGRPKLDASARELRRLGKRLTEIWERLGALYPKGNPKLYRLEVEWREYLKAGALVALGDFYNRQPWTEL